MYQSSRGLQQNYNRKILGIPFKLWWCGPKFGQKSNIRNCPSITPPQLCLSQGEANAFVLPVWQGSYKTSTLGVRCQVDAKKYGENLSPNLFAIFSRISKRKKESKSCLAQPDSSSSPCQRDLGFDADLRSANPSRTLYSNESLEKGQVPTCSLSISKA